MAQITTGFRSVFSHPSIYNMAQRIIGAERARRILVRDYFPPMGGRRMLDIGCGTAEILRHLPGNMEYVGFDASEAYIEEAKQTFGHRGSFRAELVGEAALQEMQLFDVALAFGLLHHLDDAETGELFALAATSLKPGGVLITVDPVFTSGQHPIARWLISRDRGRNVRQPEGYEALAKVSFPVVRTHLRSDLLRLPYNHMIMQCSLS
ncbi:MAG: class I SAM-dependent methyltransferase [Mariprofundaceae bacterium]|nr:class I SAM-dependent methyltransferase [Mariprofundaceae bacterium]